VLGQHKLDFTKALYQATYFYKIHHNRGNFDVWKHFYKGKFISVEDILDEEGVEVPILGGCDECDINQAI